MKRLAKLALVGTKHMGRGRKYMILLAGLAIASPSFAQETAPAGATRRFTVEDLKQYGPVTALDMVRRIPGFSIDGDDGRRGFGENAGNVLIDGNRPSTKTDSVSTILSRIPASQVEYIELTEAAGADGEARGQGQVVNVVRKKGGKISGTYEASIEFGEKRSVTPFGNVSASITRGATTVDLNAGHFVESNNETGTDRFLDAAGRTSELRTVEVFNRFRSFSFGSALRTQTSGTKINLNAKLDLEDFGFVRDSILSGPTGANIGTEALKSRGPIWAPTYEGGGDIEFKPATSLTTKLIALYRAGKARERGSVVTQRQSGISESSFLTISKPQEGIFRVQNDLSKIKSHAIQFGAEVAYNSLSSDFSGSASTNGVASSFPNAKVKVNEWRFEPFVSDVWTISPEWKLEGGIVFEKSSINVSGDSSAKRSFTFAKPKLVATWTASKTTSFEFRAERQVAQLDFDEFATSIDLGTNGQVDAGNADLVPEKTTSFSAQIRHKFLERGSIQLLGSYQLLTDTQDLVPIFIRDSSGAIVSVFDGAGNIGKSKRWNAELEITLPFDWLTKPIGVKGLELKYVGHYHGSKVTDPVTFASRRISNRPHWHQSWNLRHDLGNSGFAWGLEAEKRDDIIGYFVDRTNTLATGTEFELYAEYRKFKFGTLKFEISNPLDVYMNRRFVYFDGTRASGIVDGQQIRDRSRDMRFLFSLAGKF